MKILKPLILILLVSPLAADQRQVCLTSTWLKSTHPFQTQAVITDTICVPIIVNDPPMTNIFADGFETGNTATWSNTTGVTMTRSIAAISLITILLPQLAEAQGQPTRDRSVQEERTFTVRRDEVEQMGFNMSDSVAFVGQGIVTVSGEVVFRCDALGIKEGLETYSPRNPAPGMDTCPSGSKYPDYPVGGSCYYWSERDRHAKKCGFKSAILPEDLDEFSATDLALGAELAGIRGGVCAVLPKKGRPEDFMDQHYVARRGATAQLVSLLVKNLAPKHLFNDNGNAVTEVAQFVEDCTIWRFGERRLSATVADQGRCVASLTAAAWESHSTATGPANNSNSGFYCQARQGDSYSMALEGFMLRVALDPYNGNGNSQDIPYWHRSNDAQSGGSGPCSAVPCNAVPCLAVPCGPITPPASGTPSIFVPVGTLPRGLVELPADGTMQITVRGLRNLMERFNEENKPRNRNVGIFWPVFGSHPFDWKSAKYVAFFPRRANFIVQWGNGNNTKRDTINLRPSDITDTMRFEIVTTGGTSRLSVFRSDGSLAGRSVGDTGDVLPPDQVVSGHGIGPCDGYFDAPDKGPLGFFEERDKKLCVGWELEYRQ